jgi:hypothetical protein
MDMHLKMNVTRSVVAVAWEITTLAVSIDPDAEFAINRNTGNYTEDTARDLLTGNQLVTQTITLMFNRRDKAKSEAIHVLGIRSAVFSCYLLRMPMDYIGILKMHN